MQVEEIDFEPIERIFAAKSAKQRNAAVAGRTRAVNYQIIRPSDVAAALESSPLQDEFAVSSRSASGTISRTGKAVSVQRTGKAASVRKGVSAGGKKLVSGKGKYIPAHAKHTGSAARTLSFVVAAALLLTGMAAAVGQAMKGDKETSGSVKNGDSKTAYTATAEGGDNDNEITIDGKKFVYDTPEKGAHSDKIGSSGVSRKDVQGAEGTVSGETPYEAGAALASNSSAPVETVAPEPITEVSGNFLEALKGFEGYHLEAYKCPGGKWTIGYGHTGGVTQGMVITDVEAKKLLDEDMATAKNKVISYCQEKGIILTQGQFDAMVDFTYNCGVGAFEDSGIVELIGAGDLDAAVAELKRYIKSKGVVLPGLVTRRNIESEWIYS